ncbi:MAG: cell wall hydrolase [Methylovirgula sp.]
MGLFRVSWAVGVVAPWCLGVGLVVSISADAGQDITFGATIAPISMAAVTKPMDLVPTTSGGSAFDLIRQAEREAQAPRIVEARLVLGAPEEFTRFPDEHEPRMALKHPLPGVVSHIMPDVDRSQKGDPLVGLRPTFATQLRSKGGLARLRAANLLFTHHATWPSSAFSTSAGSNIGPESVAHFEPWPAGESPTTAHTSAAASPQQGGVSLITMRPAAINERLMQGATPALPRAVALASTTPAPADATPVEVYADAGLPKDMSIIPANRPNYAALVGEDHAAREDRCLAEAIYFEARSEPKEGQAAVAQVVLNRVASGLYPSTICGVVFQNRRHYHACQFSFACEGRSLRINEPEAWRTAVRIAEEVSNGKTYVADVGAATHYHADYVRPTWARRLKRMDVIGHHIFYKLRPGQS